MGIPLLALVAWLTWDSYRQYASSEQASYQTARLIRTLATAQTAEMLTKTRALLAALAQRPHLRSLNRARCAGLQGEYTRLDAAYRDIFSITRDGRAVCGNGPVPPGSHPAGHNASLLSEAPALGPPVLDSISGRWVTTLVHPVHNNAGQAVGVVGAALDLQALMLLQAHRDMPPKTVIGIVNQGGVLVARSEQAELRVGRQANPVTFAFMQTRREGAVVASDFQGVQRYFAFEPVPGSDWLLFVALDRAAVLQPVLHQALVRLASVMVLALVVFALALRLAHGIRRPVEALSRTMEQVGAGDLAARAAPGGPAELHHVAVQLNAMLEARLRAGATLRQSEMRFRTAFQTSPDGMCITRLSDGCFLEVNEGGARMTGWTREELVGHTTREIRLWRRGGERTRFLDVLQRDGCCAELEAEFVTKDGRVFTGLVSAQTMLLDGEPCVLSITRDISTRKAAEAQIRDLSFFDPLTGLANRRLFMDRLAEAARLALQRRGRGALIFIDLDDFRSLNETLGHEQGDLWLRETARRLRQCLGDSDTAARLGSDEFVVLLQDPDAHTHTQGDALARRAEQLGEGILLALNEPLLLGGAEHRRGASLGVTLFGWQQEEADEPLRRAELAMQQAKASGRNTLRFFEPHMQAAVCARAAMEAALRQAIEARQFLLHYQIQVTADGRVTGTEALLRWPDPRRGMVSPAEFIPLAEASGLILPLGQWVLQTACDELARWAHDPVRTQWVMAVNVSARQFHQTDFVHQVRQALQHSGADARRLKLELTEGMLVSNVEDVIAKMNALRGIGLGFSLDDFGTGYSSLAYLKRLPLCQLKIDQAFVRDILVDTNDAAIAKMIIALAGSMGLTVIAEGVETEAQRAFLAELGCQHYQGYLFGRPVAADALAAVADAVPLALSPVTGCV
ncbi:MAG: EAL domain-containing protein [Rubrivivax sp.]|nr:EAL domain-containing protein [Rubrivivax sp.]